MITFQEGSLGELNVSNVLNAGACYGLYAFFSWVAPHWVGLLISLTLAGLFSFAYIWGIMHYFALVYFADKKETEFKAIFGAPNEQ